MSEAEGRAPDEWAAINELFHEALDTPASERAAFLHRVCKGNTRLRIEVQSLLDAHDRAGDFIEAPAEGAQLARLALGSHRGESPDDRAIVPGSRDSLVGQTRGQYRVERVLGEGGMGVVYLAEDTRLGRRVALKAVAPRFAGDAPHRERLRREARAAAALAHPGIATIYALEEFGEHLFIASEYIPGETLREELARGPLPLTRLVETALDLARALAAAHERGVIHRDLKPENIIRSPSGQVKILDFGLARFIDLSDAHLTQEGMKLGTPAYMSPEQIRGQRADFRADLFALGIILAELSSGRHPFAAADSTSMIAKILEAEPANLGQPTTQTPPDAAGWHALEAIIRTCLAKSPDARFQSTSQLVAALESRRADLSTGSGARALADVSALRSSTPPALWWWQFHQGAATAAYVALLYPLSYIRESDRDIIGSAIFLIGLAAVAVSSTLRLHLWFTLRAYPPEWMSQRRSTAKWTRLSDGVFAAVLLAAAGLLLTAHGRIAMLLVTSAVAVLIASAVIEPATTRAATKDKDA